MMRAIQLAVLCVAVLVTTAGQTQAGIITNVSASTNMGAELGTSLDNTVNGVGLFSPSLEAYHEGSTSANSWVSSPGSRLGYIDFDLGGVFLVDGFSFWNHSGTGLGIRTVDVSASINGTPFTPVAVSPSEYEDAPPSIFPVPYQSFSFVTPVTASHIRFQVTDNHDDDDQTGFSEIAFSSPSVTAVPEPSSVALFGIGACVAGVAVARRRRREKQQAAAA